MWTESGLLFLSIFLFNYGAVRGQIVEKDWWETTVFYQIYPRSFQDSDGDGTGDLKGVTQRLQHLKDSGIGATWLSPFFKSPNFDSGYDIEDVFAIQPEYGTMADFDAMIAEANRLGIKIILDFVPNHTSHLCEWFQKSLNKSSEYADWYVWEDGWTDEEGNRYPPTNWVSVFRKSAWEYSPERDQYYLHQFAVQQPDLNYRNPAVVEQMKEVLRFWLRKGAAGFRIDAVNHMFEVDKKDHGGIFPHEPQTHYPDQGPDDYGYLHHIHTKDIEDTYWMVYEWRKVFDEFTAVDNVTRVMLIEAYTSIENSMKYFGNATSEGCHMPFNFGLIEDVYEGSTAYQINFVVDRWLKAMPAGKTANWVIGNHDKWRVGTRYGEKRIDGMNMLVLLLPGAGITYNGEEIGMLNNDKITWEETQDPGACNTDDPLNYWKVSRDPARTPFQWSTERNAGFSTSTNKTWLPVNEDFIFRNLESQKAVSRSTYKVYQEITKVRQMPPITHGSFRSMAFNDFTFGFERYLSGYDTYVVVINIGDQQQTVDLDDDFPHVPPEMTVAVASVGSDRIIGDKVSIRRLVLKPYEALVVKGAFGA